MKKICLIIHSLGIGGMERVMSLLANNFANRKELRVHLILIGKERNIAYPLHSSILVHRPPVPFRNSRRSLDTLKTMKFLRTKVKAISPDTILSFGEMWNNLVLLSLYGLKCPIYVSDRSQPEKNLGRLHNLLRDKLYPRAAGYIAQTEIAASICKKNGWNTNIKVIGNPVRQVKSNGSIKKENVILTVGRLIPTKHIDQLIKIFVEIDKPGWKLRIVGGDAKSMTLSKELQKLIDDLDATNSVFLEGQQKNVDSYYNRSKIFAFTSSSEGYPNVIAEALSAGLPVVSYDCVAGPADMIEDGLNGYLIELFNQEAFKEKIKLLMEDEELRNKMGNEAKKIIKRSSEGVLSKEYYNFIIPEN